MYRKYLSAFVITVVATVATAGAVQGQDESLAIENGGVHIEGWMGKIDAAEAGRGLTLEHARLAMDGSAMHVATGPAVAYWNPSNTASGSYTVSATFTEPEFMNRSNHPHPYGVFIGGTEMGTDQQRYFYCAAYGNGTFIVRGFGPEPFQMNGRRGEANDHVHKAAGEGQPVTQEIAISVTSDMVSCSINGSVVASYPKSDVVGEGKLTSTDGVYGIRFGHNTEGTVSDLVVTQQ